MMPIRLWLIRMDMKIWTAKRKKLRDIYLNASHDATSDKAIDEDKSQVITLDNNSALLDNSASILDFVNKMKETLLAKTTNTAQE